MAFHKVILAVLVALFAIYLYWPPPELTKSVTSWKSQGAFYWFGSHKIFYHRTSNANASDVLLILHSFPASSFVWRNVVANLQNSFKEIIVPDFLGLGFSDKPQGFNYTIALQVKIVTSLLESIGLQNIHVIGHDYGGTVAQELLAQSQEETANVQVLSLALLNGGIIPSTHQPLLVQRLFWQPNPIVKFMIRYTVCWPLFYSRFPALFGEKSQPSLENLTDIYSILMYSSGHYVLPDVIQFFHERHINERRWTSVLKHANIPLALIYGIEDKVNTKSLFLEKYKQTFKNSYIFTLQAGHYPQMEDLPTFLNAYHKFLKSS